MVTYPAHYNQAPQEVTVTFEVQGETPKPVAPASQVPEITSNLNGKTSTPADVTVNATAGSTVKLYNNDGVMIGEAVANDQGVATVHPTNSLRMILMVVFWIQLAQILIDSVRHTIVVMLI